MRWTERQRAMLREMGIHLWTPEVATTPAENEAVVAPAAPSRTEAGAVVAPALQGRAERGAAAPSMSLRADPTSTARPRRAEENATTARLPGLAPADWLVVAEPL